MTPSIFLTALGDGTSEMQIPPCRLPDPIALQISALYFENVIQSESTNEADKMAA